MNSKQHSVPTTINLILMLVLTAINLFAMFYLPLVLLQYSVWWLLLLVPIVLTTNTYWSLIHEGIHHILHNHKKMNDAMSRIMAILFGTVFNIAQFGHLMHHAYSRTSVDRPEVYEPGKHNYSIRTLGYYAKLIMGLYSVEFFGPLLAFCPQAWIVKLANTLYAEQPQFEKIIKNRLLSNKTLIKIRIDTIIMYALYAATFICYGSHAWVWLVFMLVRGFMVSAADNLPHYGTSVDNVRYAYNLSMSPFLSKWLLHFNLHRVHHEQPNVPWTELPKVYQANQDTCEINYFKQALKQFKGIIPISNLTQKN
jgi:fatty acid desaturase